MTENEIRKQIEAFRIVPTPDGECSGEDTAVREERRPWSREAIYLSDVCLAVHLTPAVAHWRGDGDEEDARKNLYRYLRRVHQTALEHGLVSPLACVISVPGSDERSTKFRKQIAAWGGDQDWHRGSFTLYVEDTDGKFNHLWRLSDVLQPKSEILDLPQVENPRSGGWYAQALLRALEERPPAGEQAGEMAGGLARKCAALFELDEDDREAKKQLDKRLPADEAAGGDLADWKQAAINQAREMAERETQA